MLASGENSALERVPRGFRSTRWDVVLTAQARETPMSGPALELLCELYWGPIHDFVRRDGHSPADAQDLTQEFLAWLVHDEQLRGIDPALGRFRSFLVVRLRHFLNDRRKRGAALKRGGGLARVPWEAFEVETDQAPQATEMLTPETLFERAWSLCLVRRVRDRLRARYSARGRTELFERLHPLLIGGETSSTYREIATALGLAEGAVKTAAHRLRKEFGELLRDEISVTVTDPTEIDSEIRRLILVTAG